jgi:hypothetical protein
MDVHDLARALLAETPLLVGWEQRSETVRVQTWRRIALAYYEAHRILPLIEAHTRAAVERERAACEAVAAGYRDGASEWHLNSADNPDGNGYCCLKTAANIVGSIAARKAQP